MLPRGGGWGKEKPVLFELSDGGGRPLGGGEEGLGESIRKSRGLVRI